MQKRKGCPPGGWPSQIAKREAERKRIQEATEVRDDSPIGFHNRVADAVRRGELVENENGHLVRPSAMPEGDWAMGEDEPPKIVANAIHDEVKMDAVRIAKSVTRLAAPPAPKRESENVVVGDRPQEIPATTFSFALQHVGQNLWRVVMLRHLGDKIVERKFVSHGDLKGNALARLRFMVYQLWFNERMPGDDAELVPMQPASHG